MPRRRSSAELNRIEAAPSFRKCVKNPNAGRSHGREIRAALQGDLNAALTPRPRHRPVPGSSPGDPVLPPPCSFFQFADKSGDRGFSPDALAMKRDSARNGQRALQLDPARLPEFVMGHRCRMISPIGADSGHYYFVGGSEPQAMGRPVARGRLCLNHYGFDA